MTNLINILLNEAVKLRVLNKGGALSVAKYPTSGNFLRVGGKKRIVVIGIVNAVDSELTLKLQQAVGDDGTPKDISGATIVIPATTANGKIFFIEVDVARLDINNGYDHVTLDVAGAAGSNDTVTLLLAEIAGDKIPVIQTDLMTNGIVNVVG